MFENWVGHRLLPEKTVPKYNGSGRALCTGPRLCRKVFQLGQVVSLLVVFSPV